MPPLPTFNFDEYVDRRSSNSMKWGIAQKLLTPQQCAADPLPMWVADMEFRAPAPVIEALHDAVSFGVFGYPAGPTRGYLDAVMGWQAKRFGWGIDSEWVVPTSGVITALKTAIQAFTAPGESVLIQPPVYVHFHEDVALNGRRVAPAPLVLEDGRYRFDAKIFEQAIREDTRLFILSNPHNPTGNVWSESDLRAMGEICLRNNIVVIADEIHQDFVITPRQRHIPFASLDARFAERSLTCTSASKTFNLAGLQCANLIIPDRLLRSMFTRQLERNQFNLVNLLGMVATEAAYTHGEDWLKSLLDYIRSNQQHFAASVNSLGCGLHVHEMDSLYLAWVDCRSLGLSAEELEHFMLTKARVWFDKGQKFGLQGHGFLRANLGCPRGVVDDALTRLSQAMSNRSMRWGGACLTLTLWSA
ncbi:MAG TPA: MalY/PatB family protein [Verrucomicrobiota bacterium]|nr:MalY/PatB family protein [Verrucomicrobiota bacterium]